MGKVLLDEVLDMLKSRTTKENYNTVIDHIYRPTEEQQSITQLSILLNCRIFYASGGSLDSGIVTYKSKETNEHQITVYIHPYQRREDSNIGLANVLAGLLLHGSTPYVPPTHTPWENYNCSGNVFRVDVCNSGECTEALGRMIAVPTDRFFINAFEKRNLITRENYHMLSNLFANHYEVDIATAQKRVADVYESNMRDPSGISAIL